MATLSKPGTEEIHPKLDKESKGRMSSPFLDGTVDCPLTFWMAEAVEHAPEVSAMGSDFGRSAGPDRLIGPLASLETQRRPSKATDGSGTLDSAVARKPWIKSLL